MSTGRRQESPRARSLPSTLLLAALLGVGAAGHPGRPGDAPPSAGAAPADVPSAEPCAEASDARVERRVGIQLLHASDVPAERAEAILRDAAAFLGRYGLELRTAGPAVVIEAGPVLRAERSELEDRLASLGLDPQPGVDSAERERARLATAAFVLEPVRALIERVASDRLDILRVVVLRRLAAPATEDLLGVAQLRGLTFAPAFAAAADAGSAERLLHEALGVRDYAPTVLVSADALALRPGGVETTLAHELGHALGLPHASDRRNLMWAGEHTCVPVLTLSQLARLTPASSGE